MRRGLVVLVIVAIVGGVIALIATSRPDLDKARDATVTAWTPLVPPLDARYASLGALVNVFDATLRASGEENSDVQGLKVALARWAVVAKGKDAKQMVNAANDLEARVGQLRAVLSASARITQNAAVTGAKTAFDKTSPPVTLVAAYNEAVRKYQRTRESTAKRLVAETFGYGAIPTFEPSLAA